MRARDARGVNEKKSRVRERRNHPGTSRASRRVARRVWFFPTRNVSVDGSFVTPSPRLQTAASLERGPLRRDVLRAPQLRPGARPERPPARDVDLPLLQRVPAVHVVVTSRGDALEDAVVHRDRRGRARRVRAHLDLALRAPRLDLAVEALVAAAALLRRLRRTDADGGGRGRGGSRSRGRSETARAMPGTPGTARRPGWDGGGTARGRTSAGTKMARNRRRTSAARRGRGTGRARTPSLTRARARERSAPGRSEENICRGAAGWRPAAVTRRSTRRSNEEMRPGSFARSREIRAASSAGPSCRSARSDLRRASGASGARFGSALRERASGASSRARASRGSLGRDLHLARSRPPPPRAGPVSPPRASVRPRPPRRGEGPTRPARSRRRSSSGAARSRGTSPCSSSSARASAARSSSCRGATARRPSRPRAAATRPFFPPERAPRPFAVPSRPPPPPRASPPRPSLPRPVVDDTAPERRARPLHAASRGPRTRGPPPHPPGEAVDATPPPPPERRRIRPRAAPPSRPPSRADEIDVGGARPHRSAPRRPATVPRDCSEPREFVRFHSIDPLGLDAARGSGWFEAARRRRRSSRVFARARSPREPLRVVLSLALDLVRARDDVGRSRPAPPVRGPLEAFSPERPLARVGFGRRRF